MKTIKTIKTKNEIITLYPFSKPNSELVNVKGIGNCYMEKIINFNGEKVYHLEFEKWLKLSKEIWELMNSDTQKLFDFISDNIITTSSKFIKNKLKIGRKKIIEFSIEEKLISKIEGKNYLKEISNVESTLQQLNH